MRALLTCGCASRKATKAAASFSAPPAAVAEAISGWTFARSVGLEKLKFEMSPNTGDLATR